MLSFENSLATRYPCKLFQLVAESDVEERSLEIGQEYPEYCVRVPRIVLSPCKARFDDIGIEMSNRVLRKFTRDGIFDSFDFIRVQVANENGRPLFADDMTTPVEERIHNTLLNGIEINGRRYIFLAYSSSQLKECSVWMVRESSSWRVPRMRKSLGNFSSCNTVSKWAARIGQCFSTTVEFASANDLMNKPSIIDDVPAADGKCHSDGTGIISRRLMNELVKKMPNPPSDPNDVSIVQIRFGGAKGTLSAWNQSLRVKGLQSWTVGRTEVVLRDSMNKFQSRYDNIEICSLGTTVPYYLNRNVILLLGVHGVSDHTFLGMQSEMLDDLDRMLQDRDKAIHVFPRLSGADSGTAACLMAMLCGFHLEPSQDPFLYGCLQAMRSHHLFTLRKKARVFVDKGAALVGGLDETGSLQEGCVFVSVSRRNKETAFSHVVIEGPVMVTKHPVMHPGDVRMLLAVDIPALRGHKNVIIFSQKGSRPEADKMSGSDLDGDQFAVTWDSRLFLNEWNQWERRRPNLKPTPLSLEASNHVPMDYNAPNTSSSAQMPTDENEQTLALINHFTNHLKNDNLGRLAMLWQDYASFRGANCPECLHLAQLHSIAVDFPKSGVPATIPKDLISPKFLPGHWREIKGKNSRQCRSVIGKMYDCVIQKDTLQSLQVPTTALAGRKFDKYGLVLATFNGSVSREVFAKAFVPGFSKRLNLLRPADQHPFHIMANDNRLDYEDDIRSIMNKYKIRSEGELFTGCIRKYHKLNKKKQHTITEEVRRRCAEIRNRHRSVFWMSVIELVEERNEDGREDLPDMEEVQRISEIVCSPTDHRPTDEDRQIRMTAHSLAAAYYSSSYSRPFENGSIRGSALFSFPWIVFDIILAGLVYEEN